MAGELRVAGEHREAGEHRVAGEHRASQVVPRADFKKSTFSNREKTILAKNMKIERFRPRDHENRNVLDARLSIELTRAP